MISILLDHVSGKLEWDKASYPSGWRSIDVDGSSAAMLQFIPPFKGNPRGRATKKSENEFNGETTSPCDFNQCTIGTNS
ncbi:hypothetical protein F441_10479 [Phytophthora nicotianae CJ01A1]|uniref:Uncharacterized protein n=1 Tax=Phytophthora nicotianae CJ01A1 TaxID=1317063 RepID=W2WVJ7_PHYNI|nr:hypothetical protein F441_10479 [Phytophthora nicotianae CJ01A1]